MENCIEFTDGKISQHIEFTREIDGQVCTFAVTYDEDEVRRLIDKIIKECNYLNSIDPMSSEYYNKFEDVKLLNGDHRFVDLVKCGIDDRHCIAAKEVVIPQLAHFLNFLISKEDKEEIGINQIIDYCSNSDFKTPTVMIEDYKYDIIESLKTLDRNNAIRISNYASYIADFFDDYEEGKFFDSEKLKELHRQAIELLNIEFVKCEDKVDFTSSVISK